MAIALISSDKNFNANAISLGDTSGGNLIVGGFGVNSYSSAITFSDSKSNTYSLLTLKTAAGATFPNACRMGYASDSPSVGASHTVTINTASYGGSQGGAAFSGVNGGFFAETVASSLGTTVQPGSITPPENGCLFVTIVGLVGTATPTIDAGFTLLQYESTNEAFAIAYKISNTAENPTWTHTASTSTFGIPCAMACFRVTSPPAPIAIRRRLNQAVNRASFY